MPRRLYSSLPKATIIIAMLIAIARPSGAQSDPSLVGEWSPLTPLPIVTLHMSVLPNRKLIIWPRAGAGSKAYLWDLAANTQTLLPSVQTNIFCSGHTVLADGRVFVAGGHEGPTTAGEGAKQTHIFDPVNNAWQQVADMNAGRWYPSTTLLPTREVLVAAGNTEDKQTNTLPQVFNPATGAYRDLTGAIRAQPFYPWHYVLPNGDVLDAGPDGTTWRLSNVSGVGAWAQVETTNHGLMREAGTSVMYAPGHILIVGGSRSRTTGEAPTDTAETIDMNAASPTWQYTGSLVGGGRRHVNGTILADGTVLVSGGSSSPDNDAAGAIRAAEIWDPQTGLWSVMASMNVPRLYHSSAGLLPDGRVVHAGGGFAPATGDVNHKDAEFFKPPYLFKGPRPEITDAPSNVDYNQIFFVETPDAANIARVTWVRLSSTTHSFNQNQRFNELDFSPTVGGLTVTAPANSNLSPPGHYMLFILTEDVPSVAAIIQIGVNPSAAPVAQFSGTPTSGTAPLTVSFSDSSTNSPTAWAWDFDGDAITDSTAQNPPGFVYNTPGTYTVTLTASNAAGSDAEVKTGYITVFVSDIAPPPPQPVPTPAEAEPANPKSPIPCKVSRCRVAITCNLAPDLGTACTNRINLFVRASALRRSEHASAKAPRKIRFAFGVANVPPGETANVRLKLTKRGRDVVKEKKKLKGVLEIRNAVGTAISNTPVTIRFR